MARRTEFPKKWTATTRNGSSARFTTWYRTVILNRGSMGSGPIGFEEPGLVLFRPRELMDCAGIAKPKLRSRSSNNAKRLCISSRAVICGESMEPLPVFKYSFALRYGSNVENLGLYMQPEMAGQTLIYQTGRYWLVFSCASESALHVVVSTL